MGNYTIFQMFEILGEAGKQEIFQQMFRKLQISDRLPNRYFPKIDVGCPCTLYLRAIFRYKPPRGEGGLYSEGRKIKHVCMYVWRGENKTFMYVQRRVFALRVCGAYIWRSLYMEGLIFEFLRYFVKKILKILNLSKNSSSKLFSAGSSRSIIDI